MPLTLPQQVVQQVQVWQGPYPPPEAMRDYESIQPGTFNRLVTMAEQAQDAQIGSMQRAQEFLRRDIRRGQVLGSLISLVAMGCAVFCVMHNQPWVAAMFLSVPVMAVAKALIEGTRSAAASQQLVPQSGAQSPNDAPGGAVKVSDDA